MRVSQVILRFEDASHYQKSATISALQHFLLYWYKMKGYLQMISEVLVTEGGGLQLVASFSGLEPGAALTLWVNQQRVPGSSCHQNTVLDAQLIRGQTL
jgi:hypothetical protein